ncbi:NAD(P)H-binding protein [Streptomyces uncialis]|uniref:NAD(P)H-binding protein n=1 Tax=Streptomyces uncialis TaxID=1048205 RepID=UPI003869C5E6|nr:NAD(P)H-binding protein [Streptomyces uncialis]
MTNTTSSSASSTAPVLVLGGTGKTGRRVAAELTRRGHTARPASRRGDTRFDWSDPATWEAAIDGARAVYLVDSESPEAPDQVRAFVRLAADQGVERLVLLSARVWEELDNGSREGLAVEDAVTGSGLAWTILRPAWFAQNFTEAPFVNTLLTAGELRLPTGEGREAFVDLDDLAEVAAVALTEDGHAGRTYVLSGPRALTFGEAVAEISAAAGRPLTFVALTDEEYLAEQKAAGVPQEMADLLLYLFQHIRADGSAAIGDGVRRALGREPRDFSVYTGGTDFSAPRA